jgi:hypothetical protein
MPGNVDAVAARLAEGSLVPVLGPGLLREEGVPDGPEALALWLAGRAGLPRSVGGDLARIAASVEARLGRRGLLKLLREAFAPLASPGPLHLLLAGLPSLPLAVSTWFDPTLVELLLEAGRGGARPVALVHAVSPQDRADGPWAAPEADGLVPPAASETLVFHPRGVARPFPAYLVSEADLAPARGGPGLPPEVRRRVEGRGLLVVGCPLGEAADQAVLGALLEVAAGPHLAVPAGATSVPEELFLERAGVPLLALSLERFVAGLSRRLAADARGAPGEAPGWDGGAPLPPAAR